MTKDIEARKAQLGPLARERAPLLRQGLARTLRESAADLGGVGAGARQRTGGNMRSDSLRRGAALVTLLILFFSGAFVVCVEAQTTAAGLAAALDIPQGSIVEATLSTPSTAPSTGSVAVKSRWGNSLLPISGSTLAVLSTGTASAAMDTGFVPPFPGTDFGISASDPLQSAGAVSGCPVGDGTVHDLTILRVKLSVPANASDLRFDLDFLSSGTRHVCEPVQRPIPRAAGIAWPSPATSLSIMQITRLPSTAVCLRCAPIVLTAMAHWPAQAWNRTEQPAGRR